MLWQELVEIVRAESAADVAERIEARIRYELAGLRISVPSGNHPALTASMIQKAMHSNGWNVTQAAAELGVHPSTLYRRLKKRREPTQQPIVRPDPGSLNGRLVR